MLRSGVAIEVCCVVSISHYLVCREYDLSVLQKRKLIYIHAPVQVSISFERGDDDKPNYELESTISAATGGIMSIAKHIKYRHRAVLIR